MTAAADLLDLLDEVRTGSPVDRARAVARAFRTFGQLSVLEKRRLAISVAERVAPDLVPRIEAETGIDLSREQVQAVLDMAGRLTQEDIDHLRATLTDPDARREVLEDLGDTARDATLAAAGLDDVLTPPPPGEPPVDLAPPDEEPEPEPQPEPEPEPETAPEPGPDPVTEAPAPPPPVERAPFVSIFDQLPDVTLPAFTEERPTHVPARPLPPRTRAVDRVGDSRPAARERAMPGRPDLAEQLREAPSTAARLRLLRASTGAVATMGHADRLAVLLAVPDGWGRRRALDHLLVQAAVPSDQVAELVATLESPMARAWVAGTALEVDLARLADLAPLLTASALDRLRRRHPTTTTSLEPT